VRGRPRSYTGRVVSAGPPAAAVGGDVSAQRDGAFGGIGEKEIETPDSHPGSSNDCCFFSLIGRGLVVRK
jgi:hypothetical protein